MLSSTRFTTSKPEQIIARAREDAINNIPTLDETESSQFELELLEINHKIATAISVTCLSVLERLDAEIKSMKLSILDQYRTDSLQANRLHSIERERIVNDTSIQDAEQQRDQATQKFNQAYEKYNRMPLSIIPVWLYVLISVILGLCSTALNGLVFKIFGEHFALNWITAVVIGICIPMTAHFLGVSIRQYGKKFSWFKTVLMLFIFAAVIMALIGSSLMLQNNLEFMDKLGMPDPLSQSSIMYLGLNTTVFLSIMLFSYLAHDPIESFKQLYAEKMRKHRHCSLAKTKKYLALLKADTHYITNIQLADNNKTKSLRKLIHKMGEYDQTLREGLQQEKRFLRHLENDIALYRQENMKHREDKKSRPASFKNPICFELSSLSQKQEILNHDGATLFSELKSIVPLNIQTVTE